MTNSDFNYQDFCISLREITDRRDVPLENGRTLDFLEAMTAWLDDTKGGLDFLRIVNPIVSVGVIWLS